MNRLRIEFAAEGFLTAMGREFARRHPTDSSPVKTLQDYSPADRSTLMKAVAVAIKRAQPTADESFQTWCEQRVSDE